MSFFLITSRWQMGHVTPITPLCGPTTCLQWGWFDSWKALMTVMNNTNERLCIRRTNWCSLMCPCHIRLLQSYWIWLTAAWPLILMALFCWGLVSTCRCGLKNVQSNGGVRRGVKEHHGPVKLCRQSLPPKTDKSAVFKLQIWKVHLFYNWKWATNGFLSY